MRSCGGVLSFLIQIAAQNIRFGRSLAKSTPTMPDRGSLGTNLLTQVTLLRRSNKDLRAISGWSLHYICVGSSKRRSRRGRVRPRCLKSTDCAGWPRLAVLGLPGSQRDEKFILVQSITTSRDFVTPVGSKQPTEATPCPQYLCPEWRQTTGKLWFNSQDSLPRAYNLASPITTESLALMTDPMSRSISV